MQQDQITSVSPNSTNAVLAAVYRCPYCKKMIKRKSSKQWIKSYCEVFGKYTRIQKIK